jgi:hypothetical protein
MPPHSIVRATGNQRVADDPAWPWTEVEYISPNLQSHIGWVYDGYLEDYLPDIGDVVHIDPAARSGLAYAPVGEINFQGTVLHNLSGGFCVAYIGGDGIVDFLKKCQADPASAFIFRDRPMNLQQIQQLLTAVYGYAPSQLKLMADGLEDPVTGVQITSGRMARMLQTYALMALVHMDPTGEIVFFDASRARTSASVLHWAVVVQAIPFGFDAGTLSLYNPFPNNLQTIAFRLFCQSLGANPTGLWVPRNPHMPPLSGSGR